MCQTHDCRLTRVRTTCQVSFGNVFSLWNKMWFFETLLSRKSTFNLNAVNIWGKILQNPYSRRLADCKNIVCLYVARCGTRPRLPVAQFWLLSTGNKFQIKYGVHEAKRARTVKTTSQGSYQDQNTAEKKRKMDAEPNNRSSSILGNTIHFW